MTDYLCPKCETLLTKSVKDELQDEYNLGYSKCKIYFRISSIGYPSYYRMYDDSNGYNSSHLCEGTMERCIRLYKLKAFS